MVSDSIWLNKRQVTSRFFVSLLTLTLVAAGFFSPESYHYRMLHQTPNISALLSNFAMAVIFVVTLIDVVVNDIMPEQMHVRWLADNRHWLWGWGGVTYIGYAFITAKLDTTGFLTAFFLIFGLFCACIAALDTAFDLRKRKAVCAAHSTHSSTSLSSSGRSPVTRQG